MRGPWIKVTETLPILRTANHMIRIRTGSFRRPQPYVFGAPIAEAEGRRRCYLDKIKVKGSLEGDLGCCQVGRGLIVDGEVPPKRNRSPVGDLASQTCLNSLPMRGHGTFLITQKVAPTRPTLSTIGASGKSFRSSFVRLFTRT